MLRELCPVPSALFPNDQEQKDPVRGILPWFLPQVTGSMKDLPTSPFHEALPRSHRRGLAL